nr:MAG TPA: hypothetical protein [Caudoviricetes sp.]
MLPEYQPPNLKRLGGLLWAQQAEFYLIGYSTQKFRYNFVQFANRQISQNLIECNYQKKGDPDIWSISRKTVQKLIICGDGLRKRLLVL